MDTMAKCRPLKLIFPINLFNVDVELYLEIIGISLTMRMHIACRKYANESGKM